MSEEKQTKSAVVDEGVPDIVLSTGVVLRPQEIPPRVYIRVASQEPMPKPPMEPAPGKPHILIPNHDHPNYITEVKQWEHEQQERLLFSMVIYGIEKIVKVPKGVEKHTGDNWLNKMKYTDADVFPDDEEWRRASWILEVAAKTAEDFSEIFAGVGRLSGVPEEDVQNAAKFSERKAGS